MFNKYRIHDWRTPVCLTLLFLVVSAGIASAGAWKFAVVGDSEGDGLSPSSAWSNTNVLQAIARGITNDRPDLVLFAGDLIYGSNAPTCTNLPAQYAAWSNAFSPVYSARIPVYPVRGEHDRRGDADGTIFNSIFGAVLPGNGPTGEVGLTYSFQHNNALFIGLDQYKNLHRVNQPWLSSQVASRRTLHLFVFGHEPAVQVAQSDCLAYENDTRDLFLKSITEADGRIYFCGHDHFYNRARLAPRNGIGIMQVVAGAGGAPSSSWDGVYGKDYNEQQMASSLYYSACTNGYVLVTVSNLNVLMEWKGSTNLTTWQTYDSYSYQVTNTAIRNVADYDGDSRSDLAVYSEAQGKIVVAMSAGNYLSFESSIGGLGAVAVPGDYDGDGLSDPAVYWKTNGLWQIVLTDSSNAVATSSLGGTGYAPVPADYDGDGKTDLAVYQKSSATWEIIFSSSGLSVSVHLGGSGWDPIPSDYDGDGRADLLVYRKLTGDWSAYLSAGQEPGHYEPFSFNWGGPDFLPAPADYDNDGKTDPALYDNLTGNLFAALSGSGYQTFVALLSPDCAPVFADYDGDRRADPMLYQEANAYWQVPLSASGYQMASTYYGGNGWMPVQDSDRINLVFLAFGDSITYGGGSSSDGPETGYPILLETRLKENFRGSFISINAGNPGETTEDGLLRFTSWLEENNPDLVLLMEGTNDHFEGAPYGQIEDNLRAMVQYALARGVKIIIATIPPVISNSYRDRSDQESRIVGFNPRIHQIAADFDIPLAPIFEAITAVPNWQNALMDQPSANHPNDAGYLVIRDTFYSIISSGLDSGEYY